MDIATALDIQPFQSPYSEEVAITPNNVKRGNDMFQSPYSEEVAIK